MKKNIKLNQVKKRLLILSPVVKDGIERESNKDDFEALDDKALGQGGFGQVWKVRNKHTNHVYAIKVINKSYILKENMIDQMNREIEIMYRTNHPHIIKLYNHYEDDESFYLIMELASKGQLYSLLRKQRKLDERTVAKYMSEIISAVIYLHSLDPPIIHRDIKPENVLLDNENRAKLADFGWSNFLESSKTRDTLAGTPEYLAPEMVMKSGHDYRVDIWSIGVLIFELLAGRPPFVFKNDINMLYSDIKNLKIKWTEDFPILAKDLVSKILRARPNDRISLEQAIEHPWFKQTLKNYVKPVIDIDNYQKNTNKLAFCLMTFKSQEEIPIQSKESNNSIQENNNLNSDLTTNNNDNSIVKSIANSYKNTEDSKSTTNKIKIIMNTKRESLKTKEIYGKKEDENKILLDLASLKQELKIKSEELNILKEENNKLHLVLKENSKKQNKFEEDESALKLNKLEKANMLKEIEEKTKRLLETETELNLLKSEQIQITREFKEQKRQIEILQLKKQELENYNSDLKTKITQLEEEKQNDMINYEKKIRMTELKSFERISNPNIYPEVEGNKNEFNVDSQDILKMEEMANNYIKELDNSINNKMNKLEVSLRGKDVTDLEFRTNLIENIDSKIGNLIKKFEENYEKAIEEEKKLYKKQIEDLNSKNEVFRKNMDWYKSQISELFPYKQKVKLIEEKLSNYENMLKDLNENNEILNYQNSNLEKLNASLKELQNKDKVSKDVYRNAFNESEKLFEKYSNGKKLRDLLNFKNINDI